MEWWLAVSKGPYRCLGAVELIRLHHGAEETGGLHQIVKCPVLDNLSALNHQDSITGFHRGEAMRDEDGSPPAQDGL